MSLALWGVASGAALQQQQQHSGGCLKAAHSSHWAATCNVWFLCLHCCVQISKTYTHYAATILFFFFGFKTLYDVFLGEGVSTSACCLWGWGWWDWAGLAEGHETQAGVGNSAVLWSGACMRPVGRAQVHTEEHSSRYSYWHLPLLLACNCPQGGESELDQVEQELSNSNSSGSKRSLVGEDEKKREQALTRVLYMLFSPVFLKAFTLTFLAEWGDRSQIATIG